MIIILYNFNKSYIHLFFWFEIKFIKFFLINLSFVLSFHHFMIYNSFDYEF